MKTGIVCAVMLVLGVFSATVAAYPAPEIVQKPNQWTFKVDYSQPHQITLAMNGHDKPQRYWYVILTVTNKGPKDEVSFYPACQLITDTFEVIDAGKKVKKSVFDTIKLKHQGRYPFLESLDFADRRIFRGEDNTRDFAIIWPDFDPKARQVSLFISGLSNETAVVEHPTDTEEDGNPKKIFLRKTLQLQYAIAGDENLRANSSLKEIESTWVMR
ncbi:MAG: hypothetical protein ACYSUT_01565 [Planctomycetota bacterium]|jgi:hypothetical protein